MRKYVSIITLMLVLVPFSVSVQALAISDVELHSSLNQSLDARIYLLSATDQELSSLKISVSTADVVGNQRMIALNHEVIVNQTGRYIIISSKDAIREPVLNFQIELIWSGGRMIRDYSLIIDPQ